MIILAGLVFCSLVAAVVAAGIEALLEMEFGIIKRSSNYKSSISVFILMLLPLLSSGLQNREFRSVLNHL